MGVGADTSFFGFGLLHGLFHLELLFDFIHVLCDMRREMDTMRQHTPFRLSASAPRWPCSPLHLLQLSGPSSGPFFRAALRASVSSLPLSRALSAERRMSKRPGVRQACSDLFGRLLELIVASLFCMEIG